MESILNRTAIVSIEIKPKYLHLCIYHRKHTYRILRFGKLRCEWSVFCSVAKVVQENFAGFWLEKAIPLCFRWIRWVVEADCEYGFQDIANFASVGFYLSGRNWLVGMNGIVLRTLHHLLLESQSQSSRRARNVAHMSENTIATRKLVAVSSSPYSAALCIRMPCLFEKLHCYRTRI